MDIIAEHKYIYCKMQYLFIDSRMHAKWLLNLEIKLNLEMEIKFGCCIEKCFDYTTCIYICTRVCKQIYSGIYVY